MTRSGDTEPGEEKNMGKEERVKWKLVTLRRIYYPRRGNRGMVGNRKKRRRVGGADGEIDKERLLKRRGDSSERRRKKEARNRMIKERKIKKG